MAVQDSMDNAPEFEKKHPVLAGMLFKDASEFEREHPVLACLLFILAMSADVWLWLIGATLLYVFFGLTGSAFTDVNAYILPVFAGLIFLVGIVLPIVMVIIFLQKNRRQSGADNGMREP